MDQGSPGPGAYNPSIRAVVRSTPAFTMGGKRREGRDEKLGPGTYFPRTGPSGPAFSMSGRPASDQDKEKMFFTAPRTAPAGSGGRPSPTRLLLSQVTPGPGSYSVPATSRGPAFSVAAKRRQVYGSVSPGPGAYFHKERPQSPSFSMAERFPLPRMVMGEFLDSPGPAQYRPDQGDYIARGSGPAFTMLGKWHQPQDRSIPGPGAYYPRQNGLLGAQSRRRQSQQHQK